MSARSVTVRPPRASDRPAWDELWRGYLRFYRSRLEPEVTELTWTRLLDPTVQPHGLVAELDGRLVGLAHYLFHPSTWSGSAYCYLEDLFTAPEARGRGVGRALIEAAARAAEAGRRLAALLAHPGVQRRGPGALRHPGQAHLVHRLRAVGVRAGPSGRRCG